MKKNNKITFVNIIKLIIFAFIAILIVNLSKASYDVLRGKLGYNPEIGWIDWNHAIPCGSQQLIDSYNTKSSVSSSFVINYKQRQKELFYKMQAGIDFQVDECANDTVNLYYIFTNVSEFFEERQAKVPILHSRLRSLGDKTGNNISFYCALTNTDLEDFKNSIEIEKKGKSIVRLVKYFFFLSPKSSNISSAMVNKQVVSFVNCIENLQSGVENCSVEIINKSTQIFIFDKKFLERS